MTAAGQTRFLSLRWRFLLPIFGVILVIAMLGAYGLGRSLTQSFDQPQVNLLLETTRSLLVQSAEQYEASRVEAQRIAFTSGVREAVTARDLGTLQSILESSARLADLDSVLLTNADGQELIGLNRDTTGSYSLSGEADLSQAAVVQQILRGDVQAVAGLIDTESGLMVYTVVPIINENARLGTVMVGQTLERWLAAMKAEGSADLIVFAEDGTWLGSTLVDENTALQITPLEFARTLERNDAATVRSVENDDVTLQFAYTRFQIGPQPVGVVGVVMSNPLPQITLLTNQLLALTLATVAGGVVIVAFILLNRFVIAPATTITQVAEQLAAGQAARTGLQPLSEVGRAGYALDRYADVAQERQDALQQALRRQRREAEYFTSVLEALPEGVLVQDEHGTVMLMNETARRLLGPGIDTTPLEVLTAVVSQQLGSVLTPGLYALGDPRRVEREGRILHAQAAALMNPFRQRVGTVIMLRDATDEVKLERLQERMMQRFASEIQAPMLDLARAEALQLPLAEVARGLNRHAAALQKLIVEMREMTMPGAPIVAGSQRPIFLDTLIWVIANEWRQIATAAGSTLEVKIEKSGMQVQGDERRLRWAIGNLLDNAIKYTLPGGKLTLEINDESNGLALMRVRDNGVGIKGDELPHVGTRFYRGTPTTPAGEVLRIPGTGQGLYTAQFVIQAHGGVLQVRSKVGIGTAVYFALPLAATQGTAQPHFVTDADMEGETVLVSDLR
jgi:signal transduction histidine kinase